MQDRVNKETKAIVPTFFESKSLPSDAKDIWKEDPVEAYKNFLKYVGGDVSQSIAYNKEILDTISGVDSSAEKTPIIDASRISAEDGKFNSLQPLIGHNLYCAKMTVRNINNIFLVFNFDERIFDRTVEIDAEPKASGQLQIAYRSIVPSEFRSARSIAGPMGYNEYIIDGTRCNKKNAAFLKFYINSNFNWTPIKIVLENCKGSCLNSLGVKPQVCLNARVKAS